MQKIIFFTTYGCHLCEKVEQMFSQYLSVHSDKINFELEVFDIIDDEEIMQNYRIRIPVLMNKNSQKELAWPFDYSEFETWIEN